MTNYESVRIGDLGKIVTGKTPKTEDPDNFGDDCMFIGPTDLHKHFFIANSERMISTKGLESIKSSVLNGVSILVGCIGWDMGNVGIVNGRCTTNQQINSITNIHEKYNPLYIYYWLKTKKDFLYQQASVTRTPILNKTDFSNIRINLPKEKKYQDKVVCLLAAIDKKVELNNRINAELEAMAKTLYDYWFVQFDFPDANGNPYKTSGGKMVYSPILKRDIPEGWEAGTLEDLGQIVGGSTPSTQSPDNFTTEGTPWITPNDLSNSQGNKFISRGRQDVSAEGIKSASLKKYPAGTVLLSSRAPIGYIAISRNEVTTNQGFKSFIPNKGYSSEFIYYTVKNSLKAITQYASGSTFKEVSGGTLKTVKVVLPKMNVSDAFKNKVQSIFSKQDIIERENTQLTQLRDWLLPMLMNGQVTVK
ncbi:TPA: restriction endonuclease subunit S [Aeromonas bestiarum]|nr:restriction endonuclease subunit S [Aeromonas bestiarum]